MNIWGCIFIFTTLTLWLFKREKRDKGTDRLADEVDLEKKKAKPPAMDGQASIKDAYLEMM